MKTNNQIDLFAVFIITVCTIFAIILAIGSVNASKMTTEEYCKQMGNASLKNLPVKCLKFYEIKTQ